VRLLIGLLFLVFLGTFAPPRTTPPDPPPPVTLVRFVPVEAPPGGTTGRLRFLGGWEATSNDWRFGGLSAMHVEGGEALAFSDSGWMIRFPLPGGAGEVSGSISALPEGPGSAVRKEDRDIESLAVHGPFAWLAFERRNIVARHVLADWRSDAAESPPSMENWDANRGAEAMVRLPDGRFLLVAEGEGRVSDALLFLGDPAVEGTRAVPMRYKPPAGFRATDAAMLPDGRILFLNRRLSWLGGFPAILTVAHLPEPRRNRTIEGEEVARLRSPFPVDNMEALSVTREEGRTIVWMASDDNYNPLQRTLILKFALEG
jgi:hypothetical protein